MKKIQEKKPVSKIPISEEMAEIFEKWREGRNERLTLKNYYCIIFLSMHVRSEGIYIEYGLQNKDQRTVIYSLKMKKLLN